MDNNSHISRRKSVLAHELIKFAQQERKAEFAVHKRQRFDGFLPRRYILGVKMFAGTRSG